MVGRFFNGGNPTSNCGQIQDSDENVITLLSGPPSSGKTSLLFQYAMNMAAQSQSESDYVVFICNRRRFQTKPPFLSQGIDESSPIFDRIHIKYIDDYDDEAIKKYFAAFHMLDHFPLALVLDDFADFFLDSKCQQKLNNPRGRDLAMVRVLALCHSAITHANKRSPCHLLLSDTYHDSPRLLFIYKRWISSFFIIQENTCNDMSTPLIDHMFLLEAQPSPGSFLLKHNQNPPPSCTCKRSAMYSIALQYLVLEGFIEDTQQ